MVDVMLGPWKAAHDKDKPLAEAMGNEAWKTVDKTAGFRPKKLPKDQSDRKGYAIEGVLTSVVKEGNSTHVFSSFMALVDNRLSNTQVKGNASAPGATAEEVVRAVTEDSINKILELIKKGRVGKAG
jgi:hypothetical protein